MSTVQAVLVGLPASGLPHFAERFSSRVWCCVLPLSLLGIMGVLCIVPTFAEALTWVALLVFPLLAAAAVAWAMHGAKPCFGVAALPALLVAVAARGSSCGDMAALTITAFSCVTLARLLTGVVAKDQHSLGRPCLLRGTALVRAALVVTAVADSVMVFSGNLDAPNAALNNATPSVPVPHHGNNTGPTKLDLPRLQFLTFQGAYMGYDDVFVAATLGATLAVEGFSQRTQWLAAAVTLALLLLFDLLFAVVETLPETVPVAVAMLFFCTKGHNSQPMEGVHLTSATA